MEKHNCKLFFKSFANGKALGAHMRSHLSKPPQQSPAPPSSSSEDEREFDQEDYDSYELKKNPNKNSFRLADSEVSFAGGFTVTITTNAAAADGDAAGSVVLQDRESETESSRNPNVRRRSKRSRKPEISWFDDQRHFQELNRYNKSQNQTQSLKKSKLMIVNESEPVSSISNFSPEEDVAYCLMMLSRDRWNDDEKKEKEDENQNDAVWESESESEREILNVKRTPARMKYKCDTCQKVFKSYQALGGHRASHKKVKVSRYNSNHESQNVSIEDRIYECPVCFKVFASGQALGGHKRSHFTVTASSSAITADKPVTKQRINLIDLNLPAPIEDDDVSQIEVSAVSDGEFVKSH